MSPIPSSIKILDQCKVSPPPTITATSTSTSIPLTFFDIPWLFFAPGRPLFFYEYHHSTSHFLSATLPLLKHSLSLTLHHFFPLSGNLILPSRTSKPAIDSTGDDFVTLTVAESNADFHHLIGNHPREVNEFHCLVPELPNKVADAENDVVPLLAVKITIMPMSGLCIGLAYHHVVADGRTFNNFIKTWASFSRSDGSINSVPVSYDRTVIIDRNRLEETLLNEWLRRKSTEERVTIGPENDVILSCSVRATFVVGLTEMEKIKKHIISQCNKKHQPEPVHLSPYVLVCSFVWVCLVKTITQGGKSGKYFSEDPAYFGFNAGGLTRLDFRVPASYFGNCIGFGRCMTSVGDLLGEDGIIAAANSIGNKIKMLDKAMFKGAEKWISDWEVLFGSDLHVMVHGSPKVDLYKTDFGWGRPKKIEEISIDTKKGAISLTESRETEGGIEVGLVLSKSQMDNFTLLFNQGLKLIG